LKEFVSERLSRRPLLAPSTAANAFAGNSNRDVTNAVLFGARLGGASSASRVAELQCLALVHKTAYVRAIWEPFWKSSQCQGLIDETVAHIAMISGTKLQI